MKVILLIVVLAAGALGIALFRKGDQDGDGDVDLKDIKLSAKELEEDIKDGVEDAVEDVKEVIEEVKDLPKKITRKRPGRPKKKK